MNQEMQKENKDEKKLQSLNEELQQVYTDVMGNPNMMEYNIAKQELDEVVQKVNAILGMCLNGEDPDTCEIPEGGCTGSCATCGGCHRFFVSEGCSGPDGRLSPPARNRRSPFPLDKPQGGCNFG